MRNIQFKHALFRGSVEEYGSTGQMCSGWERHVRGLYDSTRSFSWIWNASIICLEEAR